MNHVGTVPARSGLSMGSAGAGAPRTRRCALGSSRTPAPCPKHCSPLSRSGWDPRAWPSWVCSLIPQPYPGTTRAPLTPLSLEPASRASSGPDLSPVAPQLGSLPPAPGQTQKLYPRPVPDPHSLCQCHQAADTKSQGEGEQGRGERARHGGELHPHRHRRWEPGLRPQGWAKRQRP